MLKRFELFLALAQTKTVVFNIFCIQMLNKYIPNMRLWICRYIDLFTANSTAQPKIETAENKSFLLQQQRIILPLVLPLQ